MLKKEARTVFKQKRDSLSEKERMKLDDLILIQFQKIDLPFLSLVLSFYPIEQHKEVNTFLLTDFLQFQNPGLQIAYPKTDFHKNEMQAIVCESDEVFEMNQYHIAEPTSCEIADPQTIDLVLVPLLAFDKKGYRVGYGKGFYDRFLTATRPDCIKLGFSYFEPLELIDDAADFDVPLDFCITPQKAYVF